MHDSQEGGRGGESETTPTGAEQIRNLIERWRRLCSEFLPFHKDGELWRHSRRWLAADPRQGWKIHISATILSACDVLESVGPYLKESGAAFKAASSLGRLEKLNAGIFHGYGQVGKFITVYPPDGAAFEKMVANLARLIPRGAAAPAVPFDLRHRDSNIYYRYGSFVTDGDGPTIRRPDGESVLDRREIPCPDWVTPPFANDACTRVTAPVSPLTARYSVFASLSQRGKGGVYKAIDSESTMPRIRIVKEGRRHGETGWDGRDGYSRVENEAKALSALRAVGVAVPEVYDTFEAGGNFYLVMEEIGGTTLQNRVDDLATGGPLADSIYICKMIASLLADIHAAGWVWRDCKPANLFLTREGSIRPVDFEGACPAARPDAYPWSSPNFSAPEVLRRNYVPDKRFPFAEDLYSLGATFHYLIEGKLFSNDRDRSSNFSDNSANRRRRSGITPPLESIICMLLSEDPAERPSAVEVREAFRSVEGHLPHELGEARIIADVVE